MSHWTEAWVGRPYVAKIFECGDLVREVVMERRGLEITLPTELTWRRTPAAAVAAMCSEIAERTDSPVEGDGVMMRIRGKRGEIGSHAGVFVPVAGAPWVLHNLRSVGVVFQPVWHLERLSLDIEGFYRWT